MSFQNLHFLHLQKNNCISLKKGMEHIDDFFDVDSTIQHKLTVKNKAFIDFS